MAKSMRFAGCVVRLFCFAHVIVWTRAWHAAIPLGVRQQTRRTIRTSMAVERVQFEVEKSKVVGELHLPENILSPVPALIIGGPATSVKEQTTGVYAAAFAERGIAALSLDHRNFGESEGEPRQAELYDNKIADLVAGVNFLKSDSRVDPSCVGGVGIGGGAGYVGKAAVEMGPVALKALGLIAGYYPDVEASRAADPETFERRLQQGIAARRKYEATGEVEMIPAAAMDGSDAAMTMESSVLYFGPGGRAAVPNYRNEFAVLSREKYVTFDAMSAAKEIQVPTVLIHSEKSLFPLMARRFLDLIPPSIEKRMEWAPASALQTDLYDDPALVGKFADMLALHFKEHLKE